jgi:hypothetical protein
MYNNHFPPFVRVLRRRDHFLIKDKVQKPGDIFLLQINRYFANLNK